MVRRGVTPIALRILAASSATATPDVLSLAFGLACHVSKWAPIITTSSFKSEPGISPTTLLAFSTAWPILLRTSISIETGISRLAMRYIRL